MSSARNQRRLIGKGLNANPSKGNPLGGLVALKTQLEHLLSNVTPSSAQAAQIEESIKLISTFADELASLKKEHAKQRAVTLGLFSKLSSLSLEDSLKLETELRSDYDHSHSEAAFQELLLQEDHE